MQSYEQFRESERLTWPVRAVATASALGVAGYLAYGELTVSAIAAVPAAYGLDAVWDDSLADAETVYFEGGDHRSLVQVTGGDFRRLLGSAEHGVLGAHV